jgi:long-chain fatty acid transport protein
MKRLSLSLAVLIVLAPLAAHAGGMFLPARGARPLGRAGSFVAGADDGGAIYYNPAGLSDIDGVSVLFDLGLNFNQVHYDRVDSGGNKLKGVDGDVDLLPIPTLAITWKPKKAPWFTLGGGVWAPYLGLNSYPETGPTRYSRVTLDGSLVLVMELAASFRLGDHFWLGAGFQNLYLNFKSRSTLSACTELNCAPEDTSFDSLTELNVTSAFTPSGIMGAILAYEKVRAGVSVQLPFFVRADGTVKTRLPTDPFFANSRVVGDSVSVSFDFPFMVRAGVEYRPIKPVRVELGFDYEAWSMLDKHTIQPHGIYIDGVPGVGRYYLNTMYIERHLEDTFSIHIGGEYEAIKDRLVVRAGYLFESNATPDEYHTVFSPDGTHNLIALGLSVKLKKVRLDLSYGHMFTTDRTVTNSKSLQLNPIQPSLAVPVGNGTYQIATDMLALGLDARF